MTLISLARRDAAPVESQVCPDSRGVRLPLGPIFSVWLTDPELRQHVGKLA